MFIVAMQDVRFGENLDCKISNVASILVSIFASHILYVSHFALMKLCSKEFFFFNLKLQSDNPSVLNLS